MTGRESEEIDRELAEGLAKTNTITPKNFVVLHSAGQGQGFFDLDQIISDRYYSEILIENMVKDIKSMEFNFDKIAYLDKDYGPTGAISAATEISKRLDTDFSIIKLWDTLEFDELKIKGSSIEKGDSVLIIDDVITSGNTQERAQRIIRDSGADIAGIYAVLARNIENINDIEENGTTVGYLFSLNSLKRAKLTPPTSPEDILHSDLIEKYTESLEGMDEEIDENVLREDISKDVENLLDEIGVEANSDVKEELEKMYFHTVSYLNDTYV